MGKKLFSTMALTITISLLTTAFAADSISVILNGSQMEFETSPEIVNDITFVPLRAIAEALDSTVTWIDESKSINISKGDTTTILSIGNTEVKKLISDKAEVTAIEAAPYIKDDLTMVPLRFISESFGMDVDWNGATQTVTIDDTESSAQTSAIPIENISYYSEFQSVPDFGACFGYKADSLNEGLFFYDETKEDDRKKYIDLLESLGFEQIDNMVNNQVESYAYEKDGIQVVMSLYSIESMKGLYGITVQKKPEKYAGEIKYYTDYKNVPDCGVLDLVKLASTSDIAGNMTQYTYTLSSDDDLSEVLLQYTDMLKQCGFSVFMQQLGSAMYVNNETENTVIIEAGIDANNNILLDITVEQWSKE